MAKPPPKTVNDIVKDEFEEMKKNILELSVAVGNTKSQATKATKATKAIATKAKSKAKAKATAKKDLDAPKRGRTPPQPFPAIGRGDLFGMKYSSG